ncbi:MAG: DUF6599 family protein [Terracidiphilus sp.]
MSVYPEGWGVGYDKSRHSRREEREFFLKCWMAILAGWLALGDGTAFAFAQAEQPTAAEKQSATTIDLPPSPKALLPDEFDGWVLAKPSEVLTDPAQADPANAAALKEYGFNAVVMANYKRERETLSVRALRFDDATGAYGAYTYYRQNGWPKEEIGTGAASDNNRVIFWKGTAVVDATYSHIGPMTAGELREIAKQLPAPTGNRAMIPPILVNLPQSRLDGQTTHYAEGPAGYAGSGGVLPSSLVGFDKGAEAVTANYSLISGPATLTLIDYPTPQIAEAQEAAIRAYLKAGSKAQPPWPKPLIDSDQASLEVRHSGPLVVVVSGDAIPDDSHRLLESVHYEANLTAIPQPVESDVEKTSRLLMGITVLTVIGAAAAILLGGFLGGGRALYRLARGKPISSVFDEEFIHLDLREKWDENVEAIQGPHPKG